ncbi:MAG TPA: hypothetical protein VF991_04690, partial [Reyranella sp.]
MAALNPADPDLAVPLRLPGIAAFRRQIPERLARPEGTGQAASAVAVCAAGTLGESGTLLLSGAPTAVPLSLEADLLASRATGVVSLSDGVLKVLRSGRHRRSSKTVVAALLASSCLSSIDAAAQTWIGADST